jgi:DNA excision repair protein ERCC-3
LVINTDTSALSLGGAQTNPIDQHAAMGLSEEEIKEAKEAAAADAPKKVLSFEVDPTKVEEVRQACLKPEVNYPMLEEYDFRKDSSS